MLILQGAKRSTGNYQGYDYDNWVLQCTETTPENAFCGYTVETVKVPVAKFDEVFSGFLTAPDELREILGSGIIPSYNKNGKVSRIEVVDSKGKGVY